MILEYAKVRENAVSPERANPSDAGLDVFFSPAEPSSVVLNPGDSKVLSTGLKFGVPHGYMLEVKNRSSVAAKRSLIVGACVVDSGYRHFQPGQRSGLLRTETPGGVVGTRLLGGARSAARQ